MGATLLTSCASHESPISLNSYQQVTATQPATPVAQPTQYRINPLDELKISVFGEPELSLQTLPVSPDGKIVVPLLGEIKAEGRTTTELGQQIAAGLDRYLRAPQVAVNVTAFSQRITVGGSVRSAGMFPAVPGMTLMDAIALGQGIGDYGKQDEILVFRRQGAQRYIARFDLGMIQAGTAADPTLLPGDVVVVGFSEARRRFATGLAVLPTAVGIFIALLN